MPSRSANIRWTLLLQAAGIVAIFCSALLVLGLPAAGRGSLSPRVYVAVVVGSAVLATVAGSIVLFRAVARPVDRMLVAAERLARSGDGELPVLGDPDGPALSRAAVAFERVASALARERAELASKIEELTRANQALAEARESLLRSEKLATVGRLAAGIAHEVGNPLGAIEGYAELSRSRAREGRLDDLDDFLARIGLEAQRIDGIVRDLLDFARPTRPALVSVQLAEVIEDSLRLARMQPRFREVRVTLDVRGDTPPVVADPRGLAQVLLNLFLNAGDAMGGRGDLRVSARVEAPGAANGGCVALSIADDGPGIAAADLPHVFDPFFTTKEPGKGTGLGLAICDRIVASFGGEITAASVPGEGAVFTIVLRQADDAGERETA